jgi:hypothetical protein
MSILDPYEDYLKAGTSFSRLEPHTSTQLVYAVFNEDRRPLLPMVDTGLIYPGLDGQQDPTLLKYFYRVRFGGTGKLYIRAMVDNTEVQRGYVTLSEDAYQASTLRLPRGCAGYGFRLQMVGIATWRYYEMDWDPVAEAS